MYFSKLAPYLLAAAGHVALSTQQYRQPCTAVAVVDNDNNQLLVDVWTIGVLVNSVTVPYSGDFDTLPATVMYVFLHCAHPPPPGISHPVTRQSISLTLFSVLGMVPTLPLWAWHMAWNLFTTHLLLVARKSSSNMLIGPELHLCRRLVVDSGQRGG